MTVRPALASALLEGECVRLRPIRVTDVDAAFALVHRRRAITDWLIWDGPETPADLVQWYESWANRLPQGDNYQFAVIDLESGRFCGSISARFADHPFEGDVGYWVGEPFWERGFGTEAVRLIGHLCFAYLDARSLFAHVFEGNVASERVLEKNGYVEDLGRADVVEKRGAFRTRRFYQLTRSRWEQRTAGWQPARVEVLLDEGEVSGA